jgi:hypothetical protein
LRISKKVKKYVVYLFLRSIYLICLTLLTLLFLWIFLWHFFLVGLLFNTFCGFTFFLSFKVLSFISLGMWKANFCWHICTNKRTNKHKRMNEQTNKRMSRRTSQPTNETQNAKNVFAGWGTSVFFCTLFLNLNLKKKYHPKKIIF